MKRLGRIFGGLIAIALAAASLQAVAAETKQGGRNFNHMTTGFPLVGGHATAPCETCHVGGVFKGTPRNCDECHAVGKRVLATPKHNAHILTDAPCESCHFNTSTWLGARYNHGSAVPGQCMTCHSGRQAAAKPATHNTGNKATKSCDQCHRSSAWLPASWNHTGAVGTCKSCHGTAGSTEVSTQNRQPASHVPAALKGQLECDSCHSYIGWLPARFKHNTGGNCQSCHYGAGGATTKAPSGHSSFPGWGNPTACNECHYSTFAWLPALGAKPGNHIIYNGGVSCTSCHVGGSVVTGASLHVYVSTSCKTCHDSGAATTTILGVTGRKRLGSHEGSSTGQDCTSCHATQYNQWNNP